MKELKLGEIIGRVERVFMKIVTFTVHGSLKTRDSFMFAFDLLKAKCFSLIRIASI